MEGEVYDTVVSILFRAASFGVAVVNEPGPGHNYYSSCVIVRHTPNSWLSHSIEIFELSYARKMVGGKRGMQRSTYQCVCQMGTIVFGRCSNKYVRLLVQCVVDSNSGYRKRRTKPKAGRH